MRTYYGVEISRHGPNCSGLRWIAPAPRNARDCIYLRSDTLEGMKYLIRVYYKVGKQN